MVTTRLRGSKLIRVGLLIVVLAGLLGVYANINRNFPIWISSPAQPYLGNEARLMSISQLSPVLNYMSAEGMFEPGIISWRTSRVRASLSVQQGEENENILMRYDLEFHGEYQLILPDSRLNTVEVLFPFPQNLETLHDVQFLVDGEEPEDVEYSTGGIRWQDEFISNEEHTISISYRAEGAFTFSYELPKEQRTDVDVEITVVGLTGSSIPDSSLPPIEIKSGEDTETISWEYANLIDNRNIQIRLPSEQSFPQRIAEIQVELGDLADSAPILVGATLLTLAVMFHLDGTRLKIETFLLLGLGLMLFFPMVTFLSVLVGVPAGSLIALLITIGGLVVFLRQTAGWDQIGWRTILVLGIFLGVFGLGTLTQWHSLFVMIGAVLLLGVFMLLYARWQKGREELESVQAPAEPDGLSTPEPELSSQPTLHCPQCARGLEDDDNFCPSCGYETKQIQRCGNCGHEQFPPVDLQPTYCLGCGEALS